MKEKIINLIFYIILLKKVIKVRQQLLKTNLRIQNKNLKQTKVPVPTTQIK